MKRFWLALRCFFSVLFRGRLPADAAAPAPAPPPPPTAPPAAEGAAAVLALFQREGRLVDFLQEEIDTYADAQIGAAVRDIHRGCRRVLREYFAIEPVLAQPENATVQVDGGFDAGAIRLLGNVGGQPPYRGLLRHHGWRTTRIALPSLPARAEPAILAPAEVELP